MVCHKMPVLAFKQGRNGMERLETKQVNGHTYYYYSRWAKVNGKCRRVWQKYLGKLQDIVQAVEGGGPAPQYAEVFQWGLPQALWNECCAAEVISHVDRECPKRNQGLSTGEYLAIAALNRAICARSKRSLWEWFSQTTLLRHFSQANASRLTSQQFWNHMDRIPESSCGTIWRNMLQGVLERENISLESICYDGTNFYTFIDTFNVRCDMARRGKNKQGRANLRQVSYALFCSEDGQLPLFYDLYQGNRNDAKQFPRMLRAFHAFLKQIAGPGASLPETTLIFDKGNNSKDNFALVDELNLKFVGSVKPDEHKDLAEISNDDPRFVDCGSARLEGTKAFCTTKTVYGQQRTVVVTYNDNLFDAQWRTVQNDLAKAFETLSAIRQRLEDRRSGILHGGQAPTVASIEKQCREALSRQHLKALVPYTVDADEQGLPRLRYELDTAALDRLCNTYLGKNILITNQHAWQQEKIILAYRSQFLIEDVFKEIKDRSIGSWWPMNHWTDSKIRIHGLYCTVAILLRGLALRRVHRARINISMKRFLGELDGIREVINVYPRKRSRRTTRQQTVLTKTNELQDRLLSVLGLNKQDGATLG
ncbi:MAG: IS1634 family transposase [Deltaproteobacteria bacterium]|nr:IS1634 family transposase [Deltaproteobacteria bacterium]